MANFYGGIVKGAAERVADTARNAYEGRGGGFDGGAAAVDAVNPVAVVGRWGRNTYRKAGGGWDGVKAVADGASGASDLAESVTGCLDGDFNACATTYLSLCGGGSAIRRATTTKFREGVPVPAEAGLNWALMPPEHKAAVVIAKCGINLRGSGKTFKVRYDPLMGNGRYGAVRADDPTVLVLGPNALANEEELARTLAHELRHARAFAGSGSNSERAARRSENALGGYIRGER